jgi:hypothetical protein
MALAEPLPVTVGEQRRVRRKTPHVGISTVWCSRRLSQVASRHVAVMASFRGEKSRRPCRESDR